MSDEHRQQIEDCRKRDDRLSAWEADFLDSVENRLNERRELSEKQAAILDKIWDKATAKG